MKKIIGCFSLLVSLTAIGQDTISLQQCADRLLSNRLSVISERKSLQESIINRKLHYWTMIPSLSSSIGLNTNFGRRVDPYTNSFATNTVNSQSFGLSSSVTLFNGLNYFNNQKIMDCRIQLNEVELQTKQNEQLIRLVELYVNLCKQEIQINQSKVRIEKYLNIQQIQKLLIRSGRISVTDTLKGNNSLLNEQLLLTRLESDQRIKLIELNYLIGEPLASSHHFDMNTISKLTQLPVYKEKLEFEKLRIEKEISEVQLKSDRSMILPTLSLSGNLGTGFSTNNKDYTIVGNPTKPYYDQLEQNLYEGIGLYLNIPIFSHAAWLKSKQLNIISNKSKEEEIELKTLDLERRRLETEQNMLNQRSEIYQTEQIVSNLQEIFEKTLLLYRDGRVSYLDLEMSFLEWQTKLVALESLKLDNELLKLYE